MNKLIVLELFCGIGGMHFALKEAGIQAHVIGVEINTTALTFYRHNFPKATLVRANIQQLTTVELTGFRPDVILMSPPCQPFTRNGLKKDLEDTRTEALMHILSLLPDVPSLKYIMVENVKGFEDSEAREKLISCLEEMHFNFKEFMISPSQIGVPNMRTRYYLIAKRKPLQFSFEFFDKGIFEKLPEESIKILEQLENRFPIIQKVEDVLETNEELCEIFEDYLLPERFLQPDRLGAMDIVTSDATSTCCFTRSYGRFCKGTGSVFCPFKYSTSTFKSFTEEPADNNAIRELKLRYFTPREVARLMSFPEDLKFPPNITRKQRYRLLGNSLNVKVAAVLIKLMFSEPQ